jgi:hypothetical protein
MPFPRSILFEACAFLGDAVGYHGEFEDLVLRWELDTLAVRGGEPIHARFRKLFMYLRDHPEASHDGRLIADLVVEKAAAATRFRNAEAFLRAMERAGYGIQDGVIRRTLPETLDLPAADDEVHDLLRKKGFEVPLGHLDQSIDAHARGNWAAANGQLTSSSSSAQRSGRRA